MRELIINLIFVPPTSSNPYYSHNGNLCKLVINLDVSLNYTQLINTNNIYLMNGAQIVNEFANNNIDVIKLTYPASTIISIFSLLRFYHFARIIKTFSYWTSSRAQNVW